MTILVVDDSSSMRKMILFVLKGAGYDVITAVDGKDALSVLENADIDMLIADLNMPNIDGLELTRQVRLQQKYEKIPIAVLTTESHFTKIKEGRKAGINTWIIKPFKQGQLLKIVEKLLIKNS